MYAFDAAYPLMALKDNICLFRRDQVNHCTKVPTFLFFTEIIISNMHANGKINCWFIKD